MENLELKTTTTEIKSSIEELNCRMEGAESIKWKKEQQKQSNLNKKENIDFTYMNKVSRATGTIAKGLIFISSQSYRRGERK